jgi:hypothetical protein
MIGGTTLASEVRTDKLQTPKADEGTGSASEVER